MRPLAVLVCAETLLIALLGWLWLGGSSVVADGARAIEPRAAPLDSATAIATATATPTLPEPGAPGPALERQPVSSQVPPVAAADPLGILVAGTVRSTDGLPVSTAA
ncbi:MAG: hypothetical protein ABIP94_09250 [Planctomycetota bacterium]